MTSGGASKGEPQWMSWEEWRAQMLNRLFQRQGVLKQRARITPETVKHGENRLTTQKFYASEERKPSGPKAG